MTRTCSKCNIEKELDNANFAYKSKAKGKFNSICKPCWKIYRDAHYKENKKHYIEINGLYRKSRTEANNIKLLEYLQKNSCKVCGESDPIVLELDHIIEGKLADVSNLIRRNSWEVVELELKKCQVLCANCHRRKTAKERGYSRYLLLKS